MNFLTLTWWRYVLDDSRSDHGYGSWLERFLCRWRHHPCGVVFYNTGGTEPDMHCLGCGEDLG